MKKFDPPPWWEKISLDGELPTVPLWTLTLFKVPRRRIHDKISGLCFGLVGLHRPLTPATPHLLPLSCKLLENSIILVRVVTASLYTNRSSPLLSSQPLLSRGRALRGNPPIGGCVSCFFLSASFSIILSRQINTHPLCFCSRSPSQSVTATCTLPPEYHPLLPCSNEYLLYMR